MMKRGMNHGGPRSGGKIKAVSYMIAGVVALLAASSQRLGFSMELFAILRISAIVLFLVSVVLSLTSFSDYVRLYKSTKEGKF